MEESRSRSEVLEDVLDKSNASTAMNMALSVAEACKQLGVGKTTFYRLKRNGELSTLKIGSRTLVPKRSIEEYIDRQLQTGAGA
jgi:excisionase family DNA binding protein